MSAIAIGVMFLLLYEILKGMKSGRGIIAVSVFVVAIHLFGFVLGVALSFLLDFYLFYSPGMRRFFQ